MSERTREEYGEEAICEHRRIEEELWRFYYPNGAYPGCGEVECKACGYEADREFFKDPRPGCSWCCPLCGSDRGIVPVDLSDLRE